MNFQFSDDAEALRTEARKFLDAQSPRTAARVVMENDEPYDRALWQKVIDLGWPGLRIPEAHGGLGLSILELCVLAEEVGRALTPVPFSSSVLMATELLLASGHSTAKAEWLPKLAAGAVIGTVGWMEGGTASPVMMPALTLSDTKVSGKKTPVIDGSAADFILATAKSHTGVLALVLIDLSASGVMRSKVDTLDLVRKAATLDFKNTPCTILAEGAAAEKLRDDFLHSAAILLAFEGLGGAEAALEMAVSYAKERVAFGRKIGGYQAVKHRCADMYIKNQLARSHAYFGAWALSTHAAELPQAAAGARLAALDAYRFAAEENVQLHGGIGFTWESDCQFYYRRSRLLGLCLGARPFWADRLVRVLENRNSLVS
jgi:acyl-CoA dehydrogenase